MWLALVLLGLLRARQHGLLSFLIISACSRPPDRWLPHTNSMSKTDWLLHSCQGFAEPPVMIFPTVMFLNGQEAFAIFYSSSVFWSSMSHWVISWEITLRELWMSKNVLKSEKTGVWRNQDSSESSVCIISCLRSSVKYDNPVRLEWFKVNLARNIQLRIVVIKGMKSSLKNIWLILIILHSLSMTCRKKYWYG